MTNFWQNVPRPFFVLAPMADVTDPAYRALIAKCGKLARTAGWRGGPDVTWTEFVSADGLYYLNTSTSASSSRYGGSCLRKSPRVSSAESLGQTIFSPTSSFAALNPLMRDLQFTEAERPIVAQFFSSKPEMIAYAAKLAEELGFDGVDINMGCPDRAIERQGAGAALIKTPELAVELIQAAKAATSLPVSVKTRIGFNTEIMSEWLPVLLKAEPAALTLHLRTRKEMSLVPAHWELMQKAVEIRNELGSKTLLIGNGDVKDLGDARAKAVETGCDGVMLGRAIFGNPWVFAGRKSGDTPLAEKLATLVELAQEFEKLSPQKNFAILKKHIKAFVTGFDGAAELRALLMETENAETLSVAVDKYLAGKQHHS
jgi:tRNA-dihydrouridine synthase